MRIISDVVRARACITEGGILAYPTEAVYGLGCSPFNQQAVKSLLALKQRAVSKGFILLIANWAQLADLIGEISEERLEVIRATWPGPVTWVFHKSASIPSWLTGEHDSIAIRMSAHPLVHQLCENGPIISTSANISSKAPAVTLAQLHNQFPTGIDYVLTGDLGGLTKPSAIFDARSGVQLR